MKGSYLLLRVPQSHDLGSGRSSSLCGEHHGLNVSKRVARLEGGDSHLKLIFFIQERANACFEAHALGIKTSDPDEKRLILALQASDCRSEPGFFVPEQSAARRIRGDRPWQP